MVFNFDGWCFKRLRFGFRTGYDRAAAHHHAENRWFQSLVRYEVPLKRISGWILTFGRGRS